MGNYVMVVLPLFIDFGNVKFSQKPLYLCLYPPMPIELMCMTPLGPYIWVVYDSINPITLIGLPCQLNISTYILID